MCLFYLIFCADKCRSLIYTRVCVEDGILETEFLSVAELFESRLGSEENETDLSVNWKDHCPFWDGVSSETVALPRQHTDRTGSTSRSSLLLYCGVGNKGSEQVLSCVLRARWRGSLLRSLCGLWEWRHFWDVGCCSCCHSQKKGKRVVFSDVFCPLVWVLRLTQHN